MISPIQPQEPNRPQEASASKQEKQPPISDSLRLMVAKAKNLHVSASLTPSKAQPHQYKLQERKEMRTTAKAAVVLGTNPNLSTLKKLRTMALPKQPLTSTKKHLIAIGAPAGNVPRPRAPWTER